MRITGNTSQCDEEVRAGQRNAARGKAGALTRASEREGLSLPLPPPLPVFLILRRGLCGDGEGPAIVTAGTRNPWEKRASSRAHNGAPVVLKGERPGGSLLACVVFKMTPCKPRKF